MHALLAIGRVVTDQQNHCFDCGEPRDHADDRRKRSGAPRFALARLLPPNWAQRPRLAFAVGISRGQGETRRENCEAQNRWRTELTIHQGHAAGTEKQERQDIATAHGSQAENSDVERQTHTPEHKSQAKNRSALEHEASPLSFGKEESALAGEELRAGVGADAQAITEKWCVGKYANGFRETAKDPREQTGCDRLFLRFGDGSKPFGQDTKALLEDGRLCHNEPEDDCHQATLVQTD